MRKFIKLILLYMSALLVTVFAVSLFGGPYTDPYYLRFTTEKKSSLILGTSKAAQGLVPEVMNPILKQNVMPHELYNYSFTLKSSVFGPHYLNSILKKYDKSGKAGSLFVVAVDPWSISSVSLDSSTEGLVFEEGNFPPNNISMVNHNPNPEYILKAVPDRLGMIVRYFRHTNIPRVNQDGSLEVVFLRDSAEAALALADRMTEYEQYAKSFKFSRTRYEYLGKTIDTLDNKGQVVLVRIPVHPEMNKLENRYMPDFNNLMADCARQYEALYLDYSFLSDSLKSTDGNHLERGSAVLFSKRVANDIVHHLKIKYE